MRLGTTNGLGSHAHASHYRGVRLLILLLQPTEGTEHTVCQMARGVSAVEVWLWPKAVHAGFSRSDWPWLRREMNCGESGNGAARGDDV